MRVSSVGIGLTILVAALAPVAVANVTGADDAPKPPTGKFAVHYTSGLGSASDDVYHLH